MPASPASPPRPSDPFAQTLRQRRRRMFLRVFVGSSVVIFLIETLVMLLLDSPNVVPHPLIQYLDGLILAVCLMPLNYFFILRPLFRNMEEHQRTNQKLRQSAEVVERFFAITDILVAYLDADFNFIRVNQAYAKANQHAPEDFIGKNHFDLYPNAENQSIFETVVKSGQPISLHEKPFTFPEHPEYGTTYWDWTLQPVKDSAGKVEGLVLSLRDVSASRRARDKLRELALFPVFNPNPVLRVDAEGRIETLNAAALDIGLKIGGTVQESMPDFTRMDLAGCIASGSRQTFTTRLGEHLLLWSIQGAPELGLAFLYSSDITVQKRAETILQARLRLMEFANAHTLDELLQFTLDEIEALTESNIGFFHFVGADQKTLQLQTWSTNTLQKMCTAAGKHSHYDLSQAGVWTDCVRERQPVVHNDYAALAHRRGMPAGHAVVQRELTLPVLRDGKIVAILGVGNKVENYNSEDVELAATLSDFAWDVIERKRGELALRESDERVKRLYEAETRARQLAETLREASQALSASLNSATVFETLLDYLARLVPYQSAHIVLYDDSDHLVVRLARGEETWEAAQRLLNQRFELEDSSFILPLLKERRVLHYPDTQAVADTDFFQSHPQIRAWLGIPLLAGEQIIGVCGLEHSSAGFFSAEQIHWAETLTRQAAMAIHNAWLYEQVQQNRERLQALSRRLVEVQELERHHIARELHDEAGQTLASVMVGLRMIERDSADPQAVIARCREVKEIADNVLENLHRLSVDLRPAALDHLGLVAALRQHAEMVSDRHNLPVQFATLGQIERLPGEVETAVYRIVQEALTNIIRHARASRVDILLERRGTALVVVVEDNGVGMDPRPPSTDHLGMVGMRERAEMLGGTLTVESSAGKGTTIFVEVPCQFES